MMNGLKHKYQSKKLCKGGCGFTIAHSIFFILLLCISNVAMGACVSTIPASTPTADFTDNGDGTVTHSKTGLMWKQCSEGLSGAGCVAGAAGLYTWQGALQAASTLNAAGGFAGFTDWRVPNIKELNAIVENQCSLPAINATMFPNTMSGWYWSSSSYAANAANAWFVLFYNGNDFVYVKSAPYYVRLVRGGQ